MCCRRTTGHPGAKGRAEHPRRRARGGFSLVEVMIVIVIIGLLAGVVTVNVRSYLFQARRNIARQDISVIVSELDRYWGLYGAYPNNEQGLEVLTRPSEKLPEPPLEAIPVDPWGRAYQYISPATDAPYEVICLGADGRPGGEGIDADLSSKDLKTREATP